MIPEPAEIDYCQNGTFLCGVVEGFYGRPWTTEQRKKLFQRMQTMGLNTYVYAPKDDSKHRMCWRDLYSVEEAENLTGLISAAKECDVDFVYALSPGLDITFSNSKEISFLKRKLEQVQNFECSSFAMLFDDIEVEMCEPDKEIFQSFAHAQVSVTNEVYQHLEQPKFMFCPTEYCATRAVPNVSSSEYLTTIGNRLLPDIGIMWTGPLVISKKISEKSIEEIASVLKRRPIIWDNIHANDYDQKRLFLGPYEGRSPELLPSLKGVLTNPNCEFEANYIAMHTLAQWSRSSVDTTKKEELSSSPLSADIKLETEYNSDDDIPSPRPTDGRYQPKIALQTAICDWLTEFYTEATPSLKKIIKPIAPVPIAPTGLTPVNTCITSTATTTSNPQSGTISQPLPIPVATAQALGVPNMNELTHVEVSDSYLQPTMSSNPISSLLDPVSSESEGGAESAEPMDCLVTPGSTPNSSVSIPYQNDDKNTFLSESITSEPLMSDAEIMQVDSEVPSDSESISTNILHRRETNCKILSEEDIALFIDLFYLPFEHGSRAVEMLNELVWLKGNAHLVCDGKRQTATSEQVEIANQWLDRKHSFQKLVKKTFTVIDKLCDVPNRALVYDIFPYVWDMKNVLSIVDTFVDWLGSNVVYRDAFTNGEREPWVFRGGLQAEFQRLLPLDNAADLMTPEIPQSPDSTMYKVRPYTARDELEVYKLCSKCHEARKEMPSNPEYPEVLGDKYVGAFLSLSPEYCFVIENTCGEICGYVAATLDAKQFTDRFKMAWVPEMQSKYPQTEFHGDAPLQITPTLEEPVGQISEELYKTYPSFLRVEMSQESKEDLGAAKRALTCAVVALKANGSHGVFTNVEKSDKSMIEFYNKFGFFQLSKEESCDIFMGRVV